MRIRNNLTAATFVLAFALPAGADKIYKWVDEDGNVHYSDTPPPHLVEQEHKILNERGVTVDDVARVKTTEELEAERKAASAEEEAARLEAQKRAEQERRDRILLSIYATEDDLFRARDHKINAINGTIELTRANIRTQQEKLEEFMIEAAEMERRGEQVSPELLAAIDDLRNQIAANEKFIVDKKEEKEALIAKYEEDLERFRQLTTERSSARVTE